MKYLKIIFLILIFFSLSCVKEIDYNFCDTEKKVVVNCFFCPDSVFKVHLSNNACPLDTNIDIISNANIELWSNSIKIDDLYYFENGYYLTDCIAKANTPYTIKVSVAGFETIYATDTIPAKTNYQLINNEIYTTVLNDYLYSSINFSIDDDIENDFFELFFVIQHSTFTGEIVTYYDNFDTHSSVINNELNSTNKVTFSDKLFSEQIVFISINYESNKIYDRVTHSEIIDTNLNVMLHLNKISNNYYLYKKSLVQRDIIESLPDLQTTNQDYYIYSNVENGLGIFAGFNPITDTLIYEGENSH